MTDSPNPFRDSTIRTLMITPVTPLTAEQWAAFDGKARWDVLCAMRGPDHEHAILKWHTTAVLRAKMREVIRVGGMINYNQSLILIPAGAPKRGHFLSHVQAAAHWLGIPMCVVPPALSKWPAVSGREPTLNAFTALLETPA